MNKLREALAELVTALDNAFISSWQSTAAWQRQLDAARAALAEPAQPTITIHDSDIAIVGEGQATYGVPPAAQP